MEFLLKLKERISYKDWLSGENAAKLFSQKTTVFIKGKIFLFSLSKIDDYFLPV
jgi:hypothetical protein